MERSAISVSIEEKCFTRYDGKQVSVLRGLEFEARPGDLLVISGLSGCGKSTLLNIIAGLDQDYRGSITLPASQDFGNGVRNSSLPVSYMFQESCLLPWRTVKDNVSLVLQHRQGCEQSVLNMLDEMGLVEAANNYPATLSVGMQRRVALARALIVDAPLLLMDEPFSSLDESTAIHLRRLMLSKLRDTSRAVPPAVIFVTHNLHEALFFGNRLLILSTSPTALIADIALAPEPGLAGRGAREIEKLSDEIKRQYPQIFGDIAK